MKIYAVGLGPGSAGLLAPEAEELIAQCDTVAGYTTYLKLFPELFEGKKIIDTGMRGEVERCEAALRAALDGDKVVVVSSGDSGIYGMAGLLMELTEKDEFSSVKIEVIPGITAASAANAILGAPLMNDFAVLSLSDLLTPEDTILRRAQAVAASGLVCVLYNPASRSRRRILDKVISFFVKYREKETPVGVVHNACRTDEKSAVYSLGEFPFNIIDMRTIVIIGNENTVFKNGYMYTRRGYEKYYKLEERG